MLDKEVDGAGKVSLVNPGDELAAIALGPAQADADEVEQDGEDAAGCGAEDNGAAQGNRRRGLHQCRHGVSGACLCCEMSSRPPSSPVTSSIGLSSAWR